MIAWKYVDAATAAGAVSVFHLLRPEYAELSGMAVGALILIYLRRSMPWHDRIWYSVASFAFGSLLDSWAIGYLVSHHGLEPHAFPLVGGVSVLIAFPFVELLRGIARRAQAEQEGIIDWLLRRIGIGRRDDK